MTTSLVETGSTTAAPASSHVYAATSGGVDSKEALNILQRHHRDWAPLTIALVSRLVNLQNELPAEYVVETTAELQLTLHCLPRRLKRRSLGRSSL